VATRATRVRLGRFHSRLSRSTQPADR